MNEVSADEHRLDRDDRDLGGDQRGDTRRVAGRQAAQDGDPRRRAKLVVHLAGKVARARGAVEPPAPDRPPGSADAAVPRLAAGDERHGLEGGGGREDEQRRGVERLGELAAAPGQDDREHARDRDTAGDPDRRTQPHGPSARRTAVHGQVTTPRVGSCSGVRSPGCLSTLPPYHRLRRRRADACGRTGRVRRRGEAAAGELVVQLERRRDPAHLVRVLSAHERGPDAAAARRGRCGRRGGRSPRGRPAGRS